MDISPIEVEPIGPIVRLWLDRPAQRNAQSIALLDALDTALAAAIADTAVRVIIIAARGPHFSAGHDLRDRAMLLAQEAPEDRYDLEQRRYLEYCLRIWDAPKPVIAQVQGGCIAAGFMLANMCDLIVASDDAYFSDPVLPMAGAAAVEVLVHPWAVGIRRAKEMLFTGEPMGVAEAHAIGMVNRVVPRADLAEATLALAGKIASAQPFALRLMKRSLNRTADIQGFRTALDAHFDTHQLSHMGTDYQRHWEDGRAARESGAKVARV